MRSKVNIQIIFILSCLVLGCPAAESSDPNQNAKPSYAKIPNDTPLNAVKWTGGFWQDRMRRLRDIYLPGVLDGSFMTVENGATFRNLLRAADLEQGGALGRTWSDGDCYLVLDTAARLYAYCPDDYLKTRLDYWIPIIGRIQRSDGLVDSWTVLKGFDSKDGKQWERFGARRRQSGFQGLFPYNMGSLHVAATTHQQATGEDRFLMIADKAVRHWVSGGRPAMDPMQWAMAPLYSRTGDPQYLDALRRAYPETQSPFGPPLRVAPEVFGHNTVTAHYLMGATALCGFAGDQDLWNALVRLATDMLAKKTYITGAVAPVLRGQRPAQTIGGRTYPPTNIHEAVGQAYDLPNDSAYCESCGQALYMEWYYRMFRLTGEAVYMDAAERALYNTVPGCVDLDRPNFFYCNPQEQLPSSKRSHTSGTADGGMESNYTWRRQYTKKCACCPPKVMRAMAMSVEMAYNVNNEGLWVNLYGDNTAKVVLPDGGVLECRQISEYPWDGKVQLILDEVESEKPFSIFLRIPGWVDGSVRITLNGDVTEVRNISSTYYRYHRQWKSGDTMTMELPMAVRFMAAHPNVVDNWGKVAVMRGPVVYCLEGCDIPEGTTLETIYVPSNVELKPVFTEDLGSVIKLTGELVHSTTTTISVNNLVDNATETALYRKARFEDDNKEPAGKDRYVIVSMIPYYTRLNRQSDYFRIWLPVCGHKEVIAALIAKRAQLDVSGSFPNRTVLHYAAERGNTGMAELLIASGADVNAKDQYGDTPLHLAVKAGHRNIIEMLIAKGADVNAKSNDDQMPLDLAHGQNHTDIFELLRTKGADTSSLHVAARIGDLAKVKEFLEKGIDIHMKDTRNRTALHYAAEDGHKEIVELLLANGADVNIGERYYNRTAAEFAMGRDHKEIVELLISKGANISPLNLTLYMKEEAKAKELIEGGADVNRPTSYGTTPLHRAVEGGLKDIVELLIAKGADVNSRDNWDWTPLHSAVYGHNEIVELLIAKGADTTARDGGGRTPLWYAEKRGHTEIVELLRKHRAKEDKAPVSSPKNEKPVGPNAVEGQDKLRD
jgi:DUF1680 family protein/ankyrin repeat protein